LAIGSVIKGKTPAHYQWHCYTDDHPVSGCAQNLKIAERLLASHYRQTLAAEQLSGDFSHAA
jgi:hypothetical protein